eukprot:TRINITY_DN959_c1_g1_i1.p1 TRINITY_DN959_c1_g1~~TRINITY_DN959_c1_g1_i1.p1  ORF type:complete len:422 (-),score=138.04 TRINITY_DN959_c1_g1_i1:121-1386(-)
METHSNNSSYFTRENNYCCFSLTKNDVRNIVAFWICGLLNNFAYVVYLSASENLVPGNSGSVLLANILPTLCVKLTAPFYMHKIPYFIRVCISVFLAVTSLLMASLADKTAWQLTGVAFGSISTGLGEITFLAMLSKYKRNGIAAWSSGTGGAGVAGSFYYLLVYSILGVDPHKTILFVSWVNLVVLICYFFVLTKPDADQIYEETKDIDEKISVQPDSLCVLPESEDYTNFSNNNGCLSNYPKLQYYLARFKELYEFMIPLFLVYYFEYSILQGVTPTIVIDSFEHCPFTYYQFLYQVGVFLSRSSVTLFKIRYLWVPGLLQIANFVLMFCQAYFLFVPCIYFGFLVVFWIGLLGGVTYVNAVWNISIVIAPEHREFCLGVVSVANDIGISLAAVTAILIEPTLYDRNHEIICKYCDCQD